MRSALACGGSETPLSEGTGTIEMNADSLAVSAISAFEIGLKTRRGKLELPSSAEHWYVAAVEHHGLREIPINGLIAMRSALLPPLHADPCDRIIVATAMINDCSILTPDPLTRRYPKISVIW